MAQNKLENQFKQKLNQRLIEPSDKSWDRLDAMLSVSEKQKPKRNWLWIAACLITLVTVGGFFFKTNPEDIVNHMEQNLVVEQKQNNPETIVQDNTPEMETKIDVPVQKSLVLNKLTTNVAFNDSFSVEKSIKTNDEVALIEVKTESQIKKNIRYVSAELLLASVENEKKTEPKKFEPKIKVDANSLLADTENEMDETFRNKAFNELKNQYQTLKTTVSNRNSE